MGIFCSAEQCPTALALFTPVCCLCSLAGLHIQHISTAESKWKCHACRQHDNWQCFSCVSREQDSAEICSEQQWLARRDSVQWLRVGTTWPAGVRICARSASAAARSRSWGVPGSQLQTRPRSSAAEPLLVTTMAIPSAMVTATSATSSNRSMASRKEELVKKNEVPATSLTEMVLYPKHLPVPGVGGCGGGI